jgi:hypothetical protein
MTVNAVALQFDWHVLYTAEGYINLLDTFSTHIAMSPGQRDTLYRAIRDRQATHPADRTSLGRGAEHRPAAVPLTRQEPSDHAR